MQTHIEANAAELNEQLRTLSERPLSAWRRELVLSVTREVLRRTLHRQPVRSGRARAAWQSALEVVERAGTGEGELGGTLGNDIVLGDVENGDLTELSVINEIDYVPYLEYGTRHISPQDIVGQSLEEVAALVAELAPPGERAV